MRKGMAQGLARPAYYDRNGITRVQISSQSSAAPHGAVTRWTYTVPAGKKAQVDACFAKVQRITAAAPASRATCAIHVTPSGGALTEIVRAEIFTNGIGDDRSLVIGQLGSLQQGDALDGVDLDTSTGGTVDLEMTTKITEFDA